MLVTSNFSFSHVFSILSKANFNFSGSYILLSANALKLDQCEILSFGRVKPLPDNKILTLTKLEVSADNVAQMVQFFVFRLQNVRKGKNAGSDNQHLLFSQCFQNGLFDELSCLPIPLIQYFETVSKEGADN